MSLIARVRNQADLIKLPAAEIGVAEGRTSLEILTLGVPRLYLVDMWKHTPNKFGDISNPQEWHDKNLSMCRESLAKFGDKAAFLQGDSVEMAVKVDNGSLGFIFLDAGHDYQSCYNDLRAWTPKIASGGLMIGHDYLNEAYGIKEAVHKFVETELSYHPVVHQLGEGENACFCFKVQ